MIQKMLATSLFGLSLMAGSTGCFRNDIREVTFSVPQLAAPECADVIQNALASIDGVIGAEADLVNQQLTVTFNGLKLAIKNIEFVIAGAGFDVDQTPGVAGAKAALPAPCRGGGN